MEMIMRYSLKVYNIKNLENFFCCNFEKTIL